MAALTPEELDIVSAKFWGAPPMYQSVILRRDSFGFWVVEHGTGLQTPRSHKRGYYGDHGEKEPRGWVVERIKPNSRGAASYVRHSGHEIYDWLNNMGVTRCRLSAEVHPSGAITLTDYDSGSFAVTLL